MKIAAANAIAGCVADDELAPEYILPNAFDRKIADAVSDAVAKAAVESGVAKLKA